MRIRVNKTDLELVLGDISLEKTDAIVNAANSKLIPGGGVDGAIHQRAGNSVAHELNSKYPEGCPTGQAVITNAGDLHAKYIIHTVGPVWRGGRQKEPELLASCMSTSLTVAELNHCHSISIPAVSTGVYGYPLDLASRVMLRQLIDFLQSHQKLELVRLVLFDQGAFSAFVCALEEILKE